MKHSAHVSESVHGKVLEVDLHGKLTRRDFDMFVPEVESLIREHCRIRILVTLHDFEGWDAGALWEDLKWEAKHFNDIERLAIVGHKTWHKWMTGFCKPFTTARVRYFTLDELDDAHVWLSEQAVESEAEERGFIFRWREALRCYQADEAGERIGGSGHGRQVAASKAPTSWRTPYWRCLRGGDFSSRTVGGIRFSLWR